MAARRSRAGGRAHHGVRDWAAYHRALARRGDITVWVSPEVIADRRAAAGAAALVVSGGAPDDEALSDLEERAPAFRRFAEAREWLLAALGGGDGGGDGGGPGRRGGRRGQVIPLAGRRGGPRRR